MKLFKALLSFSSSGFSPCCCSSPQNNKTLLRFIGPALESLCRSPFCLFCVYVPCFCFFRATDSELIWTDFELIWVNQLDDKQTFLSAAVPMPFVCFSLCSEANHTRLCARMSATLFSEQLILNWFELIWTDLNWFWTDFQLKGTSI